MFGSKSYRFIIIVLYLTIFLPRSQAAKKDIVNFDNLEITVDNKTRAMSELTRKCLLEEDMPLAVSEKLNNKLIRYLHRSETTSITSLASSKLFVEEWYSASLKTKEWYCGHHYYRFLWKGRGFLISASSQTNLKEQLDNMKNTRWWNSAGFFVLTEDDDSSAESCSSAYEFLSLAWKYNLLSSVFLCQEKDGSLSMYSYNPYGNSAPQPWLKNREIKGQNGHPWNLFKWTKYDGRRYTCENIFFDKTTSLDGYPIQTNAISSSPFLYFDKNETGIEKYKGEDGWIMKNIWKFLNASIVNVPISDQDAILGWVDANGTFHGNLIDIFSGKVEIGLNSMILQPLWKVIAAYPHTSVNLCFITKRSSTVPWLIGLAMIFDKWTMMCTVITFFIGTIIFGYANKRRYLSGFLNTLRVFVSSSFIRPPSSTGLRMILCFIFLLPIISYSTFQGKILSLIRNPLHTAEFNSINDLYAAGFHLEGSQQLESILKQDLVQKEYVIENDLDRCILKLYSDEPVACLSYCFTLRVKVSNDENLHLGEQQSNHYQNRYTAKPDWPLLDRFDIVLQRMVEAGLTGFYRLQSWYDKAAVIGTDQSSDDTIAVIHLKDFRYVFLGLGIGWICGILVFILELVISRSKISKTRVKFSENNLQEFKLSRLLNRMKF